MTSKYKFSAICILLIMTMLSSFLILPVSAATEAEAKALAKIDPVLLEKMETASPDEKIPVAIWYTDIDQEKVDKLTVDKVGYTQDDIALTYEMPSTELINNLEKGEEDAVGEMKAYLNRTEKVRENERKRTNEYIMTRREFSRVKYNEKSAKIIKDISLEEKDITFKSQYAPMIIAGLNVAEINKSIYDSHVEMIYLYEELEEAPASIETAIEVSKINMINMQGSLNLTGENIKVGSLEVKPVLVSEYEESGRYTIPENSQPTLRTTSNGIVMADYGNVVIVGDSTYDPDYLGKNHAGAVAATLYSVAPNIKLYSSNTELYNIEGMIADGVQILTRSVSAFIAESLPSYCYYVQEKWYDHIVSTHSITTLVCAGNTGDHIQDIYNADKTKIDSYGPRVTSPGLAYNVITVGAYCDTTEGNYDPDTLYISSSYKNSISKDNNVIQGCEKPDVIAPASFNGGGTSQATPFLAGMIALMYELKPSLAAYPQVVKAIVLASSHKKVTQVEGYGETEDIYDGITERQGAGAPDAWTMMCIVCQGTYGVGRISAAKNQAVRRFVMPSYNSGSMNVSLTWIKENYIESGTSHTNRNNAVEGPDVNLDLYIYRNGQQVGSSTIGTTNTKKSSTEMAYVDLDDSNWDYEIRINDADSYNGVIRYGYAYSTNDPYITPATEEGIYYIRNYYSDKYLTLNTSTNEAEMSNFTGANNQQWVLRGTTGDYEIYPAHYSASQKINFGSQVGSNPYYKSVLGTSDLNLSMKSWETDTTLEPDAYVFTSTSGGSNNIMSYTSSTGVFVRSATESVINMYRMWVLEDINYQNGDVNMDGGIDVTDATLISEWLGHTIVLSNAQNLLADANYDGTISIQDATYIRKLIANQT